MKLLCYQIHPIAQQIIPGKSSRNWMDNTKLRYAYRCLPLGIANAMGWEILLPARITAKWTGGVELADLTVESDDPKWPTHRLASSHFGHGVLTFPISYLFRTDPGIALWVRGVPNQPKDGIAPLDGLVETDWLDFTFTMNWQFTRPGSVTFEKDEPFCFITPISYHALDEVIPEIVPIAENNDLAARFRTYREARSSFNARLAKDDPEIVKQGWQKWYMRGEPPAGGAFHPLHLSKLRLAQPIAGTKTHLKTVSDGPQSASDASSPDLTAPNEPGLT
jgi:hypothetical protein